MTISNKRIIEYMELCNKRFDNLTNLIMVLDTRIDLLENRLKINEVKP